MLVIRDDPQIDLLVKIAYGPCWGGTVVFEVRKNELGHWEEKYVFSSTSCPAMVDLSVPDQITLDFDCSNDHDRHLVALRVGGGFLMGDAVFAGVEVDHRLGGRIYSGQFFTVLALNSTQRGSLPGADHGPLGLLWDDSMTWVLSGNITDIEALQPVMVSANKIIFRDEGGDEVIFERQQYRVAIRRGRGPITGYPITGYLWMVGENRWAGIEFCQREGSQEKRPSLLWIL